MPTNTEVTQPLPFAKVEISKDIRIYDDGPNRFIVWDDREEDCPIFPTWESALAHAQESAELYASEDQP